MRKRPDYGDATPETLARALFRRIVPLRTPRARLSCIRQVHHRRCFS